MIVGCSCNLQVGSLSFLGVFCHQIIISTWIEYTLYQIYARYLDYSHIKILHTDVHIKATTLHE